MKVRIESPHQRVDFEITAEGGRLKVALQAGSKAGITYVATWGEARRIIDGALDKMRVDETR